jgi:hypothetical protein
MQDTAGREPRLRMGHLLIWIVGCAVGFAERRWIMVVNFPSSRHRVFVIGGSAVWAIAIGAVLAGCGLLAYRRWRGDTSCPSRAGHWLLLRALAVYAMSMAIRYSVLLAYAYFWIAFMIDLAFFWGLRRQLPRHWITVFLVSTILAAIEALGFGTFPYGSLSWFVIGVGSPFLDAFVILRAVGRDRRSGAPADGLHRLGVATALFLDFTDIVFDTIATFIL